MIVSFSSPTDRDKKEYVLIGMRPSCLDDKVKITAIDDDSHVGVLFMGLDTYMRLGEDYIRENAKLQHYSSMDMWCLEVSQNNYYNDQARNPDKIIPVKFVEVEMGTGPLSAAWSLPPMRCSASAEILKTKIFLRVSKFSPGFGGRYNRR